MAQFEKRYRGLPISGGRVLGRVCLFNQGRHNNMPMYRVDGEGLDRERARLARAVAIAEDQLDALAADVASRIGAAESEIFVAHKVILQDDELQQRMASAIADEGLNAEAAVATTLDEYESRLAELNSAYLRERVSDLGEIKRRVLDVLRDVSPSLQCAGDARCRRGRDRIVAAEELTPRLTLELDTTRTRGFVTERGGYTSHAGILARALGIPAVSGVAGIHGRLSCGTEILIDGDTGEVIVSPSAATLEAAPAAAADTKTAQEVVAPVEGLAVLANINLADDVDEALSVQAEGIGLYRTEFEFFAAGALLDEDAQAARYTRVVKAMAGLPVTLRLLDLGGDKSLSLLDLPEEENPYLGRRGARLLLARPDLLATQARAIARASRHGAVDVLYPMIVEEAQFEELRRRFLRAVEGCESGPIRHGVMFEVPSACLAARELLEACDFGCIGTNDLIQYLFAVDRNNELVAHDYVPGHPILWSLLQTIADAAAETGRPLSVCGEIASDPELVPRLVALGIEAISASPRLIPRARRAARESVAAPGAGCGGKR